MEVIVFKNEAKCAGSVIFLIKKSAPKGACVHLIKFLNGVADNNLWLHLEHTFFVFFIFNAFK